jgi:cbb3-type cytochrome oxidase subunit 3
MARLTKAQREWRPGMPKKRRSTRIMLASTVLTLEAFVAFFATLVVFGLRSAGLHPVTTLVGGLMLSLLLVGSCAFLAKRWGPALGWVLQLLLIATGFLEPMMFVIGVLFALAWWYALRTGARLDRDNAQRDREQAEWDRQHAADGGPETGTTTP